MTKPSVLVSFALAALLVAAAAPLWGAPKDLAADMVMIQGGQVKDTMKIFISGQKSRTEMSLMGGTFGIARRDRGLRERNEVGSIEMQRGRIQGHLAIRLIVHAHAHLDRRRRLLFLVAPAHSDHRNEHRGGAVLLARHRLHHFDGARLKLVPRVVGRTRRDGQRA